MTQMHLLHAATATESLKGRPIHLFAAESGSEIFKGLVSLWITYFLVQPLLTLPKHTKCDVRSTLTPPARFQWNHPVYISFWEFFLWGFIHWSPDNSHLSDLSTQSELKSFKPKLAGVSLLNSSNFCAYSFWPVEFPHSGSFQTEEIFEEASLPAAVNPSNYSALSSRLCFIPAHLTWVKSSWNEQTVLKNWAGCLNDCEKEQESSFHFWAAAV